MQFNQRACWKYSALAAALYYAAPQQTPIEGIVTCSFEGCDQPVLARGWCRRHYMLWYKPRAPLTSRRPRERICSVEECSQLAKAQGLCRVHYERWQRHGDPLTVLRPRLGVRNCSIEGCGQRAKARG